MQIKQINEFCRNSFVAYLGIQFTSVGDDFLEAEMDVDSNKLQPMGVMHGGASLALAETVASAGSFLLSDSTKQEVLGLQVTGNHVSTVRSGKVTARAEIIHRGKRTHVWDVKIRSHEEDKLVSVARVTNIIIDKKTEE